MDTREGMDPFLQEVFDSRFISQFGDYDWKMFYTNTSVNEYFVKDSNDGKYEEKYARGNEELNSETCGLGTWVWQIGSVALGVHVGAVLSILRGAYGVSACLAAAGHAVGNAIGSDSVHPDFQYDRQRSIANGRFLPFEREGNELENYLTRQQKGYREIFLDTFNKNTAPYNQFDAPQTQKGASDPLIAFVLSLLEGRDSFRKGSQATFVIVTPVDSEGSVSFSWIQDFFQKVYGKDNHFQVILVTLMKESGGACKRQLKSAGVNHPEVALNLQRSVQGRIQPMDICDPDLANQLAKEIKQFVYPIHRDRG